MQPIIVEQLPDSNIWSYEYAGGVVSYVTKHRGKKKHWGTEEAAAAEIARQKASRAARKAQREQQAATAQQEAETAALPTKKSNKARQCKALNCQLDKRATGGKQGAALAGHSQVAVPGSRQDKQHDKQQDKKVAAAGKEAAARRKAAAKARKEAAALMKQLGSMCLQGAGCSGSASSQGSEDDVDMEAGARPATPASPSKRKFSMDATEHVETPQRPCSPTKKACSRPNSSLSLQRNSGQGFRPDKSSVVLMPSSACMPSAHHLQREPAILYSPRQYQFSDDASSAAQHADAGAHIEVGAGATAEAAVPAAMLAAYRELDMLYTTEEVMLFIPGLSVQGLRTCVTRKI